MTPKQAGIIDTLMAAPLSGIAGALIAPAGSRAEAGSIGALVGTGMAAMANQEYESKKERGDPDNPVDFGPLFKAILAGIATGGAMRAFREKKETGRIGTGSALLAGVPAGALLFPGHPVFGAIIGGTASRLATKLTNEPEKKEIPATKPDIHEDPAVQARAAYLAAQAKLKAAREILLARYRYVQSILDQQAALSSRMANKAPLSP